MTDAQHRVWLDVRLLLGLWILATVLVYCSFPAAAAERYPVERYVAWIEAHSGLRRPAESAPEIRHVSLGEIIAVVRYARLGAYSDGVVYLRKTLPLHQRRIVAFHEIVHWMQPWGCTGDRELQAHRLTQRWARETGARMPPIPWAQVYAQTEKCG